MGKQSQKSSKLTTEELRKGGKVYRPRRVLMVFLMGFPLCCSGSGLNIFSGFILSPSVKEEKKGLDLFDGCLFEVGFNKKKVEKKRHGMLPVRNQIQNEVLLGCVSWVALLILRYTISMKLGKLSKQGLQQHLT